MGYILFSSTKTLSIQADKRWDGIIEYSYDNQEWKEWNGEEIINNLIYMRGINNTVVSNAVAWNVTGKSIKCQGNIENLLDYNNVINNVHPVMADWCFANMFHGCTDLVEAPSLLAYKLSDSCYAATFKGCTMLRYAPIMEMELLADYCCFSMFEDCTSLLNMPLLITDTLCEACYAHMFENCFSLVTTSPLMATNLQEDCYYYMFADCKSLVNSPMLPNLLVASEAINNSMFEGCSFTTVNINNKLYDVNVLRLM